MSDARALLVTGGCGFIGCNFVRHVLAVAPDVRVVNLDALTYAGNPENLADLAAHPRYRFVHGDIRDRELVVRVLREEAVAGVVHFAAESHVDRSILGPAVFVETNVLGTLTLLQAAREAKVRRFLQVSTDEVYGSLGPTGKFREDTPLAPNSPYSASKAGADHLVHAFHHTYGMNTVITRCSNNYGPYQFPEKMVPLMIHRAGRDEPLPVYGDGLQVRDWLYVDDHCAGIWTAFERGRAGGVYNLGGDCEKTNLEIVHAILAALGKPASLIRHVPDRPGHDRRYAMDASRIRRELGWAPAVGFADGLARTVGWYRDHADWVARVTSGAYREYSEKLYGKS